MVAYLLGTLLGGFFLWRLVAWLLLMRSAYRIWRYMRDDPKRGDGGERVDEPVPDEVLSRREALKVLGLDGQPDRDEVMEKYRKLIQKNHPDRGGSDYLAVLINAAKNKLLE